MFLLSMTRWTVSHVCPSGCAMCCFVFTDHDVGGGRGTMLFSMTVTRWAVSCVLMGV